MFARRLALAVLAALLLQGWPAARAQQGPILTEPDYPVDDPTDIYGYPVEQFSVMPFVFHTGLTYLIDTIGNTGITANLGQGVIQMVASENPTDDSLGQGFWYQLRFRKKNLLPFYDDSLYQNYPNPFNPATYVPFSISVQRHQHRDVHVTIKLTSMLGIDVATLIDGEYSDGWHARLMNVNDGTLFTATLPSGIYVYHMTVDDYAAPIPTVTERSRKMIYLR